MKKLSNTEAELKKALLAYKKSLYMENKVRLQKLIKFIK